MEFFHSYFSHKTFGRKKKEFKWCKVVVTLVGRKTLELFRSSKSREFPAPAHVSLTW